MHCLYRILRPLLVCAILLSIPAPAHAIKNYTNIDSLLEVLPGTRDTNRVKTLLHISRYYINRDNEKSLEYALTTLAEAEKTKIPSFIAQANLQVGGCYNGLGDYVKASVYLIHSLEIFEKNKLYKGACNAANALGNMYLGQQNNEKAGKYYREVIRYATELNSDIMISSGYVGMSNVYSATGELTKALEYIERAAAGFNHPAHAFEYLLTVMNKGNILYDLKQYEQARQTYLIALSGAERIENAYLLSGINSGLGNTMRRLGKYSQSIAYFREAIRINTQTKASDDLKKLYSELSQTFEKAKQPDSALRYLRMYVALNDSLFKAENHKQINELETKFQTAKKDAAILAQQARIKSNDAERKVRDEEDKRNALLLKVLIIGLALTVIFLVFMYSNNLQKKRAYAEVSAQKQIIEQKNTEILDSIEYARRIQKALLASDSFLKQNLPEHFILYKPKDIVSGDFYWATQLEGAFNSTNFMICTGDCTGHGVPGAFMSLLCISFLNEITRDRKFIQPNQVFTKLKHEVVQALNRDENIQGRDGMDAVLCNFDFKNLTLQMACANNPVMIVRDKEIVEIQPDKNPIGKNEQTGYDYTLHTFNLQRGDQVYMFTDGYADQFGGPAGKKFKYKQLREMIFNNRFLSMAEQKMQLEQAIEKWKGNLEQLDDILVIGIRV